MSQDSATLFSEVDTMLSGGTPPMDTPVQTPENPPMDLFATYLVSPAYYTETPDLLAVKLVTAKGEPFYLLDTKKNSRDLVCGVTEVFLTPYNADTACVDECEGLPALHLVPSCIVDKLFKSLSSKKWFVGLVFVSMVGFQFYYHQPECETAWTTVVYRVAVDKEGQIEAREDKEPATCDYPVPYLLVDESVFAEGSHTCKIVELLGVANASLIDSLCRLEYSYLHDAEQYPDMLDDLLRTFMGNHSHRIKGLLDAQLDSTCDDAFVRRERKKEIDTLVRLMMREIEIIGEIKEKLEELAAVNKAVGKCSLPKAEKPACSVEEPEEDDCEDPLLKPLMKIDAEKRARQVIKEEDIESLASMMAKPLEDDDDMDIENAELLGSPSGSECSR